MKYAVTIEKTDTGYSAYPPDLPGVGAAGETLDEVRTLIREAIGFHIEGLAEEGQSPPKPQALSEYVEVPIG